MIDRIEHARKYYDLANAIVTQAILDYKSVLQTLNDKPFNNETTLKHKRELEHFFRSKWFKKLSDLDGEELMSIIKQNVIYN